MMHTMSKRKKSQVPVHRNTPFVYLAVHKTVADRIRSAALASKTRICNLLEDWCNKQLPADEPGTDEPIVVTGQGDYQTVIRPSDLA